MPDTFRTDKGAYISIGRRLGRGGEGAVFEVNAETVAKIYRAPVDRSTTRGINTERKLGAMVAKPPPSRDSDGNVALAWPSDLLYYHDGPSSGLMAGFTMPKLNLSQYAEIINYLNPSLQRRNPNIPNQNELLEEMLQVIIRNILTILSGIHQRDYVIGDINERNIVVHETGRIAFLDADSFQVQEGGGRIHRCAVGREEYQGPRVIELSQGNCTTPNCPFDHHTDRKRQYACFDRIKSDDYFAIGVILFQMLMMGTHPFNARGVEATFRERIARRAFPYESASLQPPPGKEARWRELSTQWQEYFVDTFTTDKRYSADELLSFGPPLKRQENLGTQVGFSQGGTASAGAAAAASGPRQIQCPKCGRFNTEPAIFCRFSGCGSWMTDKGKTCPNCRADVPYNGVFCSACGMEQHPGRSRDEVLNMR